MPEQQPDLSIKLSVAEWNQMFQVMVAKDPVAPQPEPLRAILEKLEAITLNITVWNQILQIIGDGPYKTVAPLISKINIQANEQLNPGPASVVPNGPDVVEQQPMPPPEPETPSKRVSR